MPRLATGGRRVSALETALAFAKLGVHVFPVNENKEPRTLHGLLDATTDADELRRWWGMWPDAGIGAALGRSDMVAVDVDVKDGRRGPDQLKALQKRHGKLPETVRVLTPSGGWHLWYR